MSSIYGAGRPGAPPRPPKNIIPPKPGPKSRMNSSEYQKRYGATAKKDPKQVYKGRYSQENGKLFEIMLSTACEKYLDEKVAKVSKTVEPFRIIGVLSTQPKVYKCVEEKAAEPGFKGLITSGQAVAFEAKTAEQNHIEWGVVREHQRQHLEEHHNMNGLAFVMVSFGLQKFYRVPWWVWRDMKTLYGRKYLKAEEIPEFEVPLASYYGKSAVLFLEDIEDFQVCGREEYA